MRFLITLSYDGSNYKGYQKQPGMITIQEQIEKQSEGKKRLVKSQILNQNYGNKL